MAKKKKWQLDSDVGEVEQYVPSRSQKKRDSAALKELGDELAKLSQSQWKKLPLSEDLLSALQEMARISNFEGRRRQRQYIGKILRESDIAPIREGLANIRLGHNIETSILHHAESLRNALLQAVEAKERLSLLESISADSSVHDELNILIKQANNEDSPRYKRELFRRIRTLLIENN